MIISGHGVKRTVGSSLPLLSNVQSNVNFINQRNQNSGSISAGYLDASVAFQKRAKK
jgi:hypothetical protein